MKYNLVIIGITGVGKTTIGKMLADKLGKAFIDLDKAIETRCGVDIPTIFAIEGELSFRLRETKELKYVLEHYNQYVLSLGGGCLTQAQNITLLENMPGVKIIQLCAEIPELVERLSKSPNKRPLIASSDVETSIKKLIESRQASYDKICGVKINTSNLKPQQVIDMICEKVV